MASRFPTFDFSLQTENLRQEYAKLLMEGKDLDQLRNIGLQIGTLEEIEEDLRNVTEIKNAMAKVATAQKELEQATKDNAANGKRIKQISDQIAQLSIEQQALTNGLYLVNGKRTQLSRNKRKLELLVEKYPRLYGRKPTGFENKKSWEE